MLKEFINKELNEILVAQMGKRNVNSFPKITKVVLNYRIADGRDSQEAVALATSELESIAGQKPRLCKAKKSVASFKVRQNEPLALKVTLRGNRMYSFLEKLFNLVLPRLRDFRGVSASAFDNEGNYNLTIKDQTYFTEVNLDKVNKIRPIQVTINIKGSSKKEAKMLLSALGFPFQK